MQKKPTSESSLKVLGKVWPLASQVMRKLEKAAQTMPHLPEECFAAWRANKPFEEWPEALKSIIQEVAVENASSIPLIPRREAMEEIIKKVFTGGAMLAGGNALFSENFAAAIAQFDVSEGLTESAKKIETTLKISGNPHAERIIEELNKSIAQLRPRDRTKSVDNWKGYLALFMDITGAFLVKPYAGAIVGEALSGGKSDENPTDMSAVFQQIESATRIFCELKGIEKNTDANDTVMPTEEDKTFADDIRELATSHPAAAIFLTILMKRVDDPAKRQECLDYLKNSKPKLSGPHVAVSLMAQEAGDVWKNIQKPSFLRAGTEKLLLGAAAFSDLIITFPKHEAICEGKAVNALTGLEKLLNRLQMAAVPLNNNQWAPVYEAIAKEKKIHEDLHMEWEEKAQFFNPHNYSKYVLTGLEAVSGNSLGKHYRLGNYPREDARKIINAAEAWVHMEVQKSDRTTSL